MELLKIKNVHYRYTSVSVLGSLNSVSLYIFATLYLNVTKKVVRNASALSKLQILK